MRHFLLDPTPLCLALAISSLTQRVPQRSPAGLLVTDAGGSHAQAAPLPRARPVAVDMPGIALAADRHRYPAAPAVVAPERPLSHRNAIPLQDRTMPCGACIKDTWSCLSHAPHRGPGVDRKI